MFSGPLIQSATKVIDDYRRKKLTLAVAESCTGGLLGAVLTAVPGASDIFLGGFVTYSDKLKHKVLGVPQLVLKKHGAVSEKAAEAMAMGAQKLSRAKVAVAVTGIAGPGGGSKEKPVGLIYVAIRKGGKTKIHQYKFTGDRHQVRDQTVNEVLKLLA